MPRKLWFHTESNQERVVDKDTLVSNTQEDMMDKDSGVFSLFQAALVSDSDVDYVVDCFQPKKTNRMHVVAGSHE